MDKKKVQETHSPEMGRRILVADDDAAIVDAIKMMLEIADYQVETTLDGNVISKIKSTRPDLLLLDIWMSGVDGRDICRKIKQDKSINYIPVVLISASRDLAKSTKNALADDYLEKPFNLDTLLTKVEQYIKH